MNLNKLGRFKKNARELEAIFDKSFLFRNYGFAALGASVFRKGHCSTVYDHLRLS